MPDFRYYARGETGKDGRFHLDLHAMHDMVRNRPWDFWIEPFRVAPHVWMVSGMNDVCSYLLDTGDALGSV